jgi:hypothetical protein
MAELLRSGAVFIHVPKCGGSWVRAVTRRLGVWRDRVGFKHSTPEHVNHVLRHHGWQFVKHWPRHPFVTPGALRRAYKFCFIRNPVGWYESYWKYMAGAWHPWEVGRWHPQRPIDGCGSDDFNVFVRKVLDKRPGYVTEMYEWYADGSDFVGRCERMTDDLVQALVAAGERVDPAAVAAVGRVNESEKRLVEPVWDPAVLERVVEVEAEGIRRWGYEDVVAATCRAYGVRRVV